MKSDTVPLRTSPRRPFNGWTALTLRSLQSSDLELGRTSASRTFRGRYRAIAEVREMLTMKLLRPHSSLSV